MSIDDNRTDDIDWSLTTREGARREQTRRWAQMPLADMILALEKCRCLQSDFRNRLKQACPPLARYNVAGLACSPSVPARLFRKSGWPARYRAL